MINIKLNGKEWRVDPETSIADLLSRFKISPKVCVVEHNGAIVGRDNYCQTIVASDDQIEIIRMMGGG